LGVGHLERATMYCDTGYGFGEDHTIESVEEGEIAFYEEMKFSEMVEKCEAGGCEENFNYVCKHNVSRWLGELTS